MGNWKDIPGYEGLYQVSDEGSVRSVSRILCDGRLWKSAVLSPKVGASGHLSVGLVRDGQRKHYGVHCLVLTAFVGERPYKMQGAHNDGDPSNNTLSNLRWDTVKGNLADRAKHGTLMIGEKNHLSKLSASDVEVIRKRKSDGILQKHIASEFGVTPANISSIIKGKTWGSVA